MNKEDCIKQLIDTICSVRNGAMDDNQFRATVEHNVNLLTALNYKEVETLLSQSHQQGRMEMAQEIGAEIEKRATTHHKECLTDMFINGRFWEDKDLQEIINNLKTNTPTTEVER